MTGSQYFKVSQSKSDWDIVVWAGDDINLHTLGFDCIYDSTYSSVCCEQQVFVKKIKKWKLFTKYKINIIVPYKYSDWSKDGWLSPTIIGKLWPELVQTKPQRAKLFNGFHSTDRNNSDQKFIS